MFAIFIGSYVLILLLLVVSGWKLYEKTGHPGWASIIPIYNAIIYMDIVGKPRWWLLLLLIPFVNFITIIVIAIWTTNLLSKKFGKDVGFTVGLLLLPIVFYPILAFGDAQYQGAGANKLDLID